MLSTSERTCQRRLGSKRPVSIRQLAWIRETRRRMFRGKHLQVSYKDHTVWLSYTTLNMSPVVTVTGWTITSKVSLFRLQSFLFFFPQKVSQFYLNEVKRFVITLSSKIERLKSEYFSIECCNNPESFHFKKCPFLFNLFFSPSQMQNAVRHVSLQLVWLLLRQPQPWPWQFSCV